MSSQLVSFIIPTFDQERFIGRAVQSALDQTAKNVEVIVIDDGSRDRTWEVLSTFRNQKLKILKQDNQGPSAALNACLSVAQGDWIAILGGDDIAEPDRAAYQLEIVRSRGIDAAFSIPSLIDEHDDPISDAILGVFQAQPQSWDPAHVFRKLVLDCNFLCAPTAFLRRRALDEVGLYNEALVQLQDYEHAMRWTSTGFTLQVFGKAVTRYRRPGNSLSISANQRAIARELEHIWANVFDYGTPANWRRAFPERTNPTVDMDRPLTVVDEAAICFGHSWDIMRSIGMQKLISAAERGNMPLPVKDYMAVLNATLV